MCTNTQGSLDKKSSDVTAKLLDYDDYHCKYLSQMMCNTSARALVRTELSNSLAAKGPYSAVHTHLTLHG